MSEIFNISFIIEAYGYIGIFIIVFLESGIFFALPGDSLLFTAGVLAGTTYLKLYYLIPVIFVATFLGGIVGYFIGVHLEKLRKYSFFRRILKEEHINYTHEFFEKHGKYAIIISRFVPIARTFAPIIAGIAHMNYKKFLKYNLISSLVWSFFMTLLGFFLGRAIPQIKDYLSIYILSVVLISILPVLYQFIKKKKI